ncbi:LysR family transcriptional regulator [Pedobacter foliorum]|uniref:LysR family transcriptional regulator n=1 Tax=Pedobacter foliorum TaxID=2739058 RepID=UPI001566B11E|nr:LysR family transcriptional regulator [Pedobacter foliorum]NRF38824.1 LysR family transcriptional regulator [Pedobacter foliorum]
MIFDFRLKVFQTVALKLSFTKAAAELFITQPAVTRHIRELEKQLNTALFVRNGNHIALTTAGNILLKYATKIFETYLLFESELAQLNDGLKGNLRIGASTTLAQTIMPKILALFKTAYPEIQFTFTRGNTESITQQVIGEKIDVAIVEGQMHYPQINYEKFSDDELVLVTKSGNPLARKGEIVPQQLLDLPLVLREHGSGTLDVISKALSEVGINLKDLRIELQLESNVSIKQYLLHSESAAFLSMQTIVGELKRNELSIVDIKGVEMFRAFQFIQLHGRTSKIIESFKLFCRSHSNI